MATWFTADTHFGHANIIRYCRRPFNSAEEMDEAIITRWNERVKDGDIVYHLGDLTFGDPFPYLKRLNGDKHLILGNHDKTTIKRAGLLLDSKMLASISSLKEITEQSQHIVLCHYGMRVWNRAHHGSLHFYGHSHGTLPGNSQSLDVGVDCWDFRPVSLDEIKERLAQHKASREFDHHKPRD